MNEDTIVDFMVSVKIKSAAKININLPAKIYWKIFIYMLHFLIIKNPEKFKLIKLIKDKKYEHIHKKRVCPGL